MPIGALPVWKTFSQKARFCFGPKTVVLRFLPFWSSPVKHTVLAPIVTPSIPSRQRLTVVLAASAHGRSPLAKSIWPSPTSAIM